jgi:hypothetical protein
MMMNIKDYSRLESGLSILMKRRNYWRKLKMAKDYTLRNGKDASIMNRRQSMAQSQHSAANAFVKGEQEKMKKMGGKAPSMEGRYMEFDACMVSNGAHAQALAKKITSDIDHLAYPVRQDVDMSQD